MSKHQGYVPIYRKIKEHWLWKKGRKRTPFEAWIDLLLSASHSDQKEPVGYDLIMVKTGQVLTSQQKLAIEWKWSRHAVNIFLQKLRDDNMIEIFPNQKYTLITVCKYGYYKEGGTSKGPVKDIKGTTEGHQKDTYNNVNNVNKGGKSAEAQPTQKTFRQLDETEFYEQIAKHKNEFSKNLLRAFYNYWSEKAPSGKMKFQLEGTWELKKRLDKWQLNEDRFNQKNLNGKGVVVEDKTSGPPLTKLN